MIKAWSDEAWEDFEYWQSQDKKTLKRIMKLIKDIDRNGYVGIGKPEPLTGDETPSYLIFRFPVYFYHQIIKRRITTWMN